MSVFSSRGKINRRDFAIWILLVWLVVSIIYYFVGSLLSPEGGAGGYLVLKSVIEITAIIVCLPLVIKRLRDIGWPIKLAVVFVFAGVFSLRNYALAALYLTSDNFISASAMLPGLVFNVVALIVLLFLFFKPGAIYSNHRNQP